MTRGSAPTFGNYDISLAKVTIRRTAVIRVNRLIAWSLAVCAAFALAGCESPHSQLMAAVTRNDILAVEKLLDSPGVDLNIKSSRLGQNPLSSAASLNRVEIVKLLLNHGANPNIADSENDTPLMAACHHGNIEIVSMLLAAGADVNAAETRYGYTPLASAVQKGHIGIVRILLDKGADPSIRLNNGFTPRDLAGARGYTEIVGLFDSRR
jgi:ankyrin repeat protein